MSTTVGLVITIVGTVTVLAIVLSQKAQTSSVLQSAGGFATSIINAAVAPVSGTTPTPTYGSNAVNATGAIQ